MTPFPRENKNFTSREFPDITGMFLFLVFLSTWDYSSFSQVGVLQNLLQRRGDGRDNGLGNKQQARFGFHGFQKARPQRESRVSCAWKQKE